MAGEGRNGRREDGGVQKEVEKKGEKEEGEKVDRRGGEEERIQEK